MKLYFNLYRTILHKNENKYINNYNYYNSAIRICNFKNNVFLKEKMRQNFLNENTEMTLFKPQAFTVEDSYTLKDNTHIYSHEWNGL